MKDPASRTEIRLLAPEDSLAELTLMIRRAYKRLADMGLRFVATWQDEKITRGRALKGECYVAVHSGRLVGTIVYYPPGHTGECEYYRRPGVGVFGQYAVDPDYQQRGIGSSLLAFVERRARETGAAVLALDTSEKADHLIELYEHRGYRIVETADWEVTNYKSVIMIKELG